eukprot:TRINITY_DN934_c0_g1_i1.p1 TRINITY_DN934_c0_g1~~TRINITY_DN934_c0_g1_i1.p1  ORF type:complete len:157 (-),score=25.11 TRINITY_DN934_c0_g1_i1:61-531(-)
MAGDICTARSRSWKSKVCDTLAHNKKTFVSSVSSNGKRGFWRLHDGSDKKRPTKREIQTLVKCEVITQEQKMEVTPTFQAHCISLKTEAGSEHDELSQWFAAADQSSPLSDIGSLSESGSEIDAGSGSDNSGNFPKVEDCEPDFPSITDFDSLLSR